VKNGIQKYDRLCSHVRIVTKAEADLIERIQLEEIAKDATISECRQREGLFEKLDERVRKRSY
jgi:hypothetical protein